MSGFDEYEQMMQKLEHKTGKSCLYIKLAHIDLSTLKELVR
jgi:hypothetical protein